MVADVAWFSLPGLSMDRRWFLLHRKENERAFSCGFVVQQNSAVATEWQVFLADGFGAESPGLAPAFSNGVSGGSLSLHENVHPPRSADRLLQPRPRRRFAR